MNIVQALFSGKGRMRRRDFWLYSILALVIYYVVVFLLGFTLALARIIPTNVPHDTAKLLAYSAYPLFIWMTACITAKRWHDRDKSGWMYLIILVPFVGAIWTLVECGFLDGTQRNNSFGPSPKGIGTEVNVF